MCIAPVLKTYRLDGIAGLVNETYEDTRRGRTPKRYRSWSYQPGDIVRQQLFEGDEAVRSPFPVGLVLWCCDNNESDAIGILWSSELP